MAVVAFVDDLMDRSRISAAIPEVTFVREVEFRPGISTVFVDLNRYASMMTHIRATFPEAHITAFGSHVERATFDAALTDGANRVVARSGFFADPAGYTRGHGYER